LHRNATIHYLVARYKIMVLSRPTGVSAAIVDRRQTADNREIGKLMRTNPVRLLWAVCALLCIIPACGHKPQPHSVTLRWEAPRAVPGASIVGYNIYRSTASGGQFVKLASRVPAPTYEDRLVMSGRTYFYVVTSIDQSGHESRYSTEIRATIP
jgi:hypothetical protein